MKGGYPRDLSGFSGFLQLFEEVGPHGADFFVDLCGYPGGIAFYFVEHKEWQVRIFGEEVDIGDDYFFEFLVYAGFLIVNVDGYTLYELPEVLQHDDIIEFFLAAEVIVQQGEIDAGFFGDVSGSGSGEAFLGE